MCLRGVHSLGCNVVVVVESGGGERADADKTGTVSVG